MNESARTSTWGGREEGGVRLHDERKLRSYIEEVMGGRRD